MLFIHWNHTQQEIAISSTVDFTDFDLLIAQTMEMTKWISLGQKQT